MNSGLLPVYKMPPRFSPTPLSFVLAPLTPQPSSLWPLSTLPAALHPLIPILPAPPPTHHTSSSGRRGACCLSLPVTVHLGPLGRLVGSLGRRIACCWNLLSTARLRGQRSCFERKNNRSSSSSRPVVLPPPVPAPFSTRGAYLRRQRASPPARARRSRPPSRVWLQKPLACRGCPPLLRCVDRYRVKIMSVGIAHMYLKHMYILYHQEKVLHVDIRFSSC